MTNEDQTRPKHGTFRRNLVRSLLALAAIALVLAWQADVFKSKTAPGETEDLRTAVDSESVIRVESVEVSQTRHLMGSLVARSPVVLLARVAGEVREVAVEAGDRVVVGDLLVRLDDERLQARRDEAAAAVEVALAEEEGLARLLRRIEAAAEASAVPETEAIDARRAWESAARRVAQTRAALRAAEDQLGDTRLRSSLEGVVVDTFKNPGDWVPPGEPLLRLYDPGRMEIEVGIPDGLADSVEPGLSVRCFIEPLDASVTATVRTVVPWADPGSRTVLAKLALDPPAGAVPGMFVKVDLNGESETILRVPRSAVRRVRQLDFVQAVDSDGRAVPRWVRLGSRSGDFVTVLSGLSEGERILRDYEAPKNSAVVPSVSASSGHE